MDNKILINQLIETFQSIDTKYIYAYMYCSSHQGMGDIIQIPKEDLKFFDSKKLRKYSPYLIYVWGWPGPDYNTYYFQDYGKTWAFSKEELESNINFIIQNSRSEQFKEIKDSWEEIIKNKDMSKYKIGDIKNLKINGKEIPLKIVAINFQKGDLNEQ